MQHKYNLTAMTDPEVHRHQLEESGAQTCQPCRPPQTLTVQLLNTMTQGNSMHNLRTMKTFGFCFTNILFLPVIISATVRSEWNAK